MKPPSPLTSWTSLAIALTAFAIALVALSIALVLLTGEVGHLSDAGPVVRR